MKLRGLLVDLIAIICGVLCIIFKKGIIGIVGTVLAIYLIVYGVILIVYARKKDKRVEGIIRIACGVIILIIGWTLVEIALYVLAGMLICYGVYNIYLLIKQKIKKFKFYMFPLIEVVTGILLVVNQLATLDWLFIVIGVILIANAIADILINDYLGMNSSSTRK